MIKPSDLRKQAEELIQSGYMPKLEDLLQAVAETRQKYKPQIEASQNETIPGSDALAGK
jgi:hypothetical protein